MGNREIKRKMRDAKRLVTVSLCSFERLVMNELLKAEHLSVSFFTDAGEVEAVRDVSFTVEKGEVLAIVGESGCGKSALCKSIMKLLPKTAKIKSGKILVNGADITDYTEKNMSRLRGELFSMVFQDPMTSLNPTITVGKQIGEAVRIHNKKMSRGQIRKRVIELMQLVEIDRPEERIRQYPHEFSGGMRQRAVMAIALAGDPKILFADEPTTALDVTIQAQILDLINELKEKLGTSVMMITHDLGVIASMCDEIIVMYGGRVCERGTADAIFYHPAHEYTKGLLRSIPKADNMNEKLIPIGGTPINLLQMPEGCAFCPRCESAMKICLKQQPAEFRVGEDHLASCWMNVKEIYEAQEGGSNEQ